jgi:putative Ca2+/H+ antiporter (TMEM165/GDT1 family)
LLTVFATVVLGAASALVVTSAIDVVVGGLLAQYVNPKMLSWLAGRGFVLIGLWTIVRA